MKLSQSMAMIQLLSDRDLAFAPRYIKGTIDGNLVPVIVPLYSLSDEGITMDRNGIKLDVIRLDSDGNMYIIPKELLNLEISSTFLSIDRESVADSIYIIGSWNTLRLMFANLSMVYNDSIHATWEDYTETQKRWYNENMAYLNMVRAVATGNAYFTGSRFIRYNDYLYDLQTHEFVQEGGLPNEVFY